MELGTTIIGLVAIALCMMPFVMMHRSRKNKEQMLINGLKKIAKSQNSDLATCDCGVDFSIGISSSNRYVFFYKNTNTIEFEQFVSMEGLKSCEVDTVKRTVTTEEGAHSVIDQVTLVFVPKDRLVPQVRFVLFHSEEHFQLDGELQLARKWQAILADNLHN